MEPVVLVSFHAPVKPTEWAPDFVAGLIGDRLAAGANIASEVRSVFWWEGKVQDVGELLVEVTTRQGLVPTVVARIDRDHPYVTPGIRWHPIEVPADYHAWVLDSTGEHENLS